MIRDAFPDGWYEGTVGDFFSLQRGFDITQEQAVSGNVPVISSSGISYFHDTAKVEAPGVVTGRKGLLGAVYYVGVPFWPHDTTLWVKDFKGNDPKFVKWFLEWFNLARFDAATSVPTLNRNIVHKQRIAFPPLPEQRAIAAILSTWDEAITLTERLIAALQERKRGLMQRLLTGEVRFPEFEGQEWEEMRLGDFFYEISDRHSDNEELIVLSCSKIYGIVPQTEIFDKRVASANTENYKVVEVGDLVIDPNLLWDASLGFLENVPKGIVSPAYTTLRIRPESSAVRHYFRYLLKTHYYREHYKFISQGTNVRRRKAPTETFLGLKVWIGSPEEQRRITDVLDANQRQLKALSACLNALRQQKKGLMQRLLTGEIRVRID